MRYLVTWTMPIDADSPEDAAVQALGIQSDPESIATVFRVEDDQTGRSDLYDVDRNQGTARLIHEHALSGKERA